MGIVDIKHTSAAINQMQSDGVIRSYAIAGALGAKSLQVGKAER